MSMPLLKELLHAIDEESREGLIDIESWRWPDVDHLATMGFKFMDDYHMQLDQSPKMVIYRKKNDGDDRKKTSSWYIEEPKRSAKRFKTFNDVIDFFDTYKQPSIDDKF